MGTYQFCKSISVTIKAAVVANAARFPFLARQPGLQTASSVVVGHALN
jgi:hypothetical protein